MGRRDTTPPDVEPFYDLYLDACRAGGAEDPDAFFARQPGIETGERQQIRALHRVLGEASGDKLPFERLGAYRLLKRLGGGGMGTVYVAEQDAPRRLVALKVIRPELQASETVLKRFEREALAIAKLRHPNVVTVYELGNAHGVRYLAMEFVPGQPLSEIVAASGAAGERPPVPRILGWIRQVAGALDAAHKEGVVHRDVKPANILITPDDRAVLLDFGMAHLTEVEATTLTRSFAGSPSYAAPEQLGLGEVDARTDVYALGVSLYECLTDRLPFAGGTMEALFRQILTKDPPPPRKLNPAVEPAIDVVTLKAMEKRPEDRYQSATELAADLEAVLHAQPIRARPPSARARVRRYANRNPARAATIATVAVAALVFAAYLVHARWSETRKKQDDARDRVATAKRILVEYRASRGELLKAETRHEWLRGATESSYRTNKEDREFEAVVDRREALTRARQASFLRVLDLLRLAEKLDPSVPGADAVRARLYLEKMEEAAAARDFASVTLYRGLIDRHDPDGVATAHLRVRAQLNLITDPPGADVFLFRFRELAMLREGGERRLVPVPAGVDPSSLPFGSWALRVVRGAGDIAPGDLILDVAGHPIRDCVLTKDGDRLLSIDGEAVRSITDLGKQTDGDARFVLAGAGEVRALSSRCMTPAQLAERGGVAARVYRGARLAVVQLPPGLTVRVTAAPRFLHASALVGRTPCTVSVEPGPIQVLFRRKGFEDLLWSCEPQPAHEFGHVRWLNRVGATPAGFVYVAYGEYWIQERETTCREYVEFLNALPAAERSTRVPRHGRDRWAARADGSFAVPDDWHPDWPVIGVSYDDAVEYAAWRGRRDGRTYALPTRAEWVRAADGDMKRAYTWGNVFRPKWLKSCFARPSASPEPVMRYPIDESPYGAYDMCGSAAEWLDDWFDKKRGYRRLGGSSWGMTNPDEFNLWGGLHAAPDVASHNHGFRLVFRREP